MVYISDQVFASMNASEAALHLLSRTRGLADGDLLVLQGLDRIGEYGRCGAVALEELRRVLRQQRHLHVVATCAVGGDLELARANPALLHEFRVARTREFTENERAELFRRAVARRDAVAFDDAAEAAARLVGHLNLRGARLMEHLAEQAVASARGRGSVRVSGADLPATPSRRAPGWTPAWASSRSRRSSPSSSPRRGRRGCGVRRGCPRPCGRRTWSSPAVPAPARPWWRALSAGCSPSSGCSPPVTWSPSTAPTWWGSTSGTPR
ncbi:hypothetical protein [Nonomuraea recticatena]|uniref:hypothetical protein n=1 Tax=Nonomuraea recticatena TaxID=46178 RepID=UPI0036180653